MQIIVNDTSCLIDLRKAGLLHAALLLPFAFQIALPLLCTALLDFTRAEIEDLIARGLAVIDLPPDSVGRAMTGSGMAAWGECARLNSWARCRGVPRAWCTTRRRSIF